MSRGSELIEKAVKLALSDFSDSVFDKSQRYVPVVTGALKASGYINYDGEQVEIGYKAPYASERENIVPKHSNQINPRGTFYVRRAALESMPEFMTYLSLAIRRLGGKTSSNS